MRGNDEGGSKTNCSLHSTGNTEILECLTCKHTESTGTMRANTHTHTKNDFLSLPQHNISLPWNQFHFGYVIGLVGQLKHRISFSTVEYRTIHKEVSTHIKINLILPPSLQNLHRNHFCMDPTSITMPPATFDPTLVPG